MEDNKDLIKDLSKENKKRKRQTIDEDLQKNIQNINNKENIKNNKYNITLISAEDKEDKEDKKDKEDKGKKNNKNNTSNINNNIDNTNNNSDIYNENSISNIKDKHIFLFADHKKLTIIGMCCILITFFIFIIIPFTKTQKKEESKTVADANEIEIIKMAIDSIYTFDKTKISKYFDEFDEAWLTELDFTSNLASSDDLKQAKNLKNLKKVKTDLLKTVLLNDVSELTKNLDETTNHILISVNFKAINLEEVTKNIVSSLLATSIEKSKKELTVDEIVDAYVESFKSVTKTEYSKTEETATIEMYRKDGHWVIKDFRKFINKMIPGGQFYKEYMDSLNDKTKNISEENKDTKEETVVDTIQKLED